MFLRRNRGIEDAINVESIFICMYTSVYMYKTLPFIHLAVQSFVRTFIGIEFFFLVSSIAC